MTDPSAVCDRLDRLRIKMKNLGVYAYYIPTSDFHLSEYINDHFKVREFFSGFTGSAGDLLVMQDKALLWTDGRYFIQAERELQGTGISLMRSGEDGVDTLEVYLKKTLPEDATLGFDGRTVSVSRADRLKKAVPSHGLKYKKDLSEGIFVRPPLPRSAVEVLQEDVTGQPSTDKIAALRQELEKSGSDAIFLTDLEEIAYLFNIRADDIRHTPVPMSYAYITREKAYIFLSDEKADTGYPASIVRSYDEIYDFLKSRRVSGTVFIDKDSLNYRCFRLIKKRARIVCGMSPVKLMKAVKNSVELSHIKAIFRKDSIALTRFIRWITNADDPGTEISAARKLLEFREKIPEFRDLSFETISAYADNAAIIHYQPSEEHDRVIEKKGLYLTDSGGQYLGGTTDVTRTIVMGDLSEEEKEAYTLAACGMLRIRYAKFKKGTTGASLDILARERMWKKGMDYRHGTGHGVGYMLGVHEGPQSISQRIIGKPAELLPGMLVSDEPGIYREDRFGVRIEDILYVKEDQKTEDGLFFCFEDLTKVPIDDRGIDQNLMSSEEKEMYEKYRMEVIDALAPDLDREELEWLYHYSGLTAPEN